MKLIRFLTNEVTGCNPSVLFYPSAGFDHGGLFRLNYDIFILSERGKKGNTEKENESMLLENKLLERYGNLGELGLYKYGRKWVLVFWEDNNSALDEIEKSGLKLDCFIGVNDGCRDGNYECVNNTRWMHRVSNLLNDESLYVTDHSPIFFRSARNHNADHPKWHVDFAGRTFDLARVYSPEGVWDRGYDINFELPESLRATYSQKIAVFLVSEKL